MAFEPRGREINDKQIEKAAKLYKDFHEKSAKSGKLVNIKMDKAMNALEVGQFYAILYIAGGKKYLHKFNKRNRPLVFVSSDGKQIFILKGGYRFTDRGFIG